MKLYAFITPEISKNDGYLKIGETNGDVDKRIKEQGHTLNTKIVKVWQDAILTERKDVDKKIHQYLRNKGFHNQIFQDTGEYTELIKCDVEDLKKAFDFVKQQIRDEEKQRQELCDKFYLEIRNWFYWTAKTGDDPYSVAEPEYTLRLIIRLLLCFFLQDKGLVPKELFDENFIKENLKEDEEYRYYNAILRNLFFNCLNTPIKERPEPEHKKLIKNIRNIKDQFNKVPFLNGGLFYEIEGDNFPLNHEHFFCEPTTRHILELDGDYKVAGIIKILSQYKYKLSVDDLVDSEYAQTVDPEFIGKVFESLLACIDADSKENRRKTTGSFYTPREIVDYMVNEALDSYLKNYSQKNSQKNSQNDSQDNLHNDSKKDLQNDSPNDSALLQCKILDPACGSGAFPCGVMNEIMRRIDPDKKLTQQERYHKKLEILQKVIYCVDIQSMAVQISSLRFFLALIQEIIPDKKKDNYGIEPLPNLETKFICANALIGLTKENGKLQLQNIKKTIELLQRTRERHIIAANMQEKKELQNYDKDLRKLLSAAMEDAGELSHETAELLLKWNPYDQTKSTPFFDPQWMFGIENGFDIVISNPPYVNVEKIDKTIKNNISQFRTAYQKYDLYILFYEKAIDLLKPNGQLSYITSNKFLSQGYGLLLRKEFLKYYIHTIINFNYDIFENATVRTCILNLQKTNRTNENIKIIDIQTEKDKYKFSQLKYNFINQNIFNETIENNFRINLTNKKIEIINKIRQNTFRIDDIFSVNYGLRPSSEKLGLKKAAFIFETNETGQYKKYFEGKDMGKWKIKSTSYINYQPDVMYNSMFVELFENKKLVGLRTLSDIEKLRFIYDEDNLYCNDSVVILVLWYLFNNVKYQTISRNITKEKIECSKKFDYFFVQGILNSRLIKFYVNELLYDGTHFYPNHIKSLPIKNITIKQQRPIITLVNKIHSEKSKNPNADTTKLESKIDRLVYELYDLTEDEIKIIEG